MKRTPIPPDLGRFPAQFHSIMHGVQVYDSSCSPTASVWFIDKDQGFYLKSAPKGTLKKEAELTRFFHGKHLAAEVLAYFTEERDWLLTERICGEDCTHRMYLDDPKRLCETTAQLLRSLHDTPFDGCPVPNRTKDYLETAARNYQAGHYDASLFPGSFDFASAEEAWKIVEEHAKHLKSDTLLHGDYCLPNIMLDNWRFSGFVDPDSGGVGDRHVDIFWGVWTLFYNLKTNQYQDRFLDAYGRDAFEPEMLRIVAACEVFG